MRDEFQEASRAAPTDALPGPSRSADGPVDSGRNPQDYLSSRHSRLSDQLTRPLESRDPRQAAAVCAEVTRRLLLDFAPGLTLLPPAERLRAQALAAFCFTLWDFARQSGLEGERLSQINRWEFSLEAALMGEPVFVQIAELERRAPWSRDGFDRLLSAARRRATVRRPATAETASRDSREFGGAVAELLLGSKPSPDLGIMAAALLRIHSLRMLAEDLRRHQARLPVSDLPETWETPTDGDLELLGRAVRAECDRIRPLLLRSARAVPDLPQPYRRSGKYLLLAGIRLLNVLEDTGSALRRESPRLGAASRLALLTRACWLPLHRL
jgi:phytoene/squalene synthetase